MDRPAPERLLRSTYPWSFDIPPRFGDLDPMRHLNNAALVRFYEDGRIRFIDSVGGRATLEAGYGFVVAAFAVQYLAQGSYPQAVTVSSGVVRLGRSSLRLAHALFQSDACIGVGETTLVHVQRGTGAAWPLPAAFHQVLGAYSLVVPIPAALQTHPDPGRPRPQTSKEDTHA